MDLTILSKKQIEILETLKKSILLNSLSIASVEDISAMKVISLIQRGLKKDFVDLSIPALFIPQTQHSRKPSIIIIILKICLLLT
ncbi:hypothetical protein KJ813_02335 [bacterium]|nr:hypothetical protein [bacterium]MBU4361484.1 hypothetical protein [bacterium]MBU4601746.1 hypothetical protein [bacterium]